MITARRMGGNCNGGAAAIAVRQARGERQNRQFHNQRQREQKESKSQNFRDVVRYGHKGETKVC